MIKYRILDEYADVPEIETAEINGAMFMLWMRSDKSGVGEISLDDIERDVLESLITNCYIEIIEGNYERH